MKPIKSAKQLYSHDVGQTADSIEALDSRVFACGTYKLQISDNEETTNKSLPPSKRVGSIGVFRITPQSQNTEVNVTQSQVLPGHGILDMKCITSGEKKLLAAADSAGSCILYAYSEDNLKLSNSLSIDESKLTLSVDWFKTPKPEKITVSLSSGEVALIGVHNERLEVLNKWTAHSFEAWITAADISNKNLIYSGGDDCLLKIWDIRQGFHRPSDVSKHFTMGVCSIQSLWCNENLFSVGSYDENLVLWDKRNMKKCISETSVGGGVWRIKWHPLISNIVMTACMHNGFHIHEYNNTFTTSNKICAFDKQAQLAYGADWCTGSKVTDRNVQPYVLEQSYIATCSFYDHTMKVWNLTDSESC